MGHRRQGAFDPEKKITRSSGEKKTGGLLQEFDELFTRGREAFSQERLFLRAHRLGLSSLVCLGRSTVTGLIGALGLQFCDWSADYRLFSREGRFNPQELFNVVREGCLSELSKDEPLVVAIDDSHLEKTGKKIKGAGWRRDSHAPPFITNFIWAQRTLQISAALPAGSGPAQARMVPIDFVHAPTATKPRKGASLQEFDAYKAECALKNIGRVGAKRLEDLRAALDLEEGPKRDLIVTADGRFTNGTFLKALAKNTTLIGRVRKDTHLHFMPEEGLAPVRGRKRSYGEKAPTPEELRKDQSVPWESIKVWAAGKVHECRVKTLAPLRWRAAGEKHDLKLVVIAPIAYRPRKGTRLLYRDPAYLICNDPNLSAQDIVKYYVWRWDIEVNFRDEKQLFGVGQAQVRGAPSVERVPQLIVAAYAMLLLAAHRVFGSQGTPDLLPPPKWRRNSTPRRASTKSLIDHLRAELWGTALGVKNFSGFTSNPHTHVKPEKLLPQLSSAVFYAVG